jgi:hypothetical protein
MAMVKGANLALAFLLELCLLVAFGYWGFTTGSGLLMQIVLGIGAPLLVAVVWGIFMAPKALRPLPFPIHQIIECVIFGLGFVALYVAGQPMLATIFAVVFAVNFVLRSVWR